jgi:hypothetical protein
MRTSGPKLLPCKPALDGWGVAFLQRMSRGAYLLLTVFALACSGCGYVISAGAAALFATQSSSSSGGIILLRADNADLTVVVGPMDAGDTT